MKCTCGDVMTVDAANKEEAVTKLKEMMSPDAVAQHFSDKHPGQPVPSQDQVGANIESSVVEGDLSAETPAGGMSGTQEQAMGNVEPSGGPAPVTPAAEGMPEEEKKPEMGNG